MDEVCEKCQYRKEKRIETAEEETFISYYCPLNECMFSDFDGIQFDNVTGSMNL